MSSDLVDVLKCYVPALIVRRLASDPIPIAEPTAERISAVVMFVDITDFTSLADRLSTDEIAGSEDLAIILNDCFGLLINIIHSHGGEVTKFAGDALIALWPVSPDLGHMGLLLEKALAEKARIATHCSLVIQESLRGYKAAEGTPLLLQIGIGAGDVYSVYLGGVFDRWEFLLSGGPLVQMSIAKEQASPGTVVLSPEVWELVKDVSVGKPLKTGFIELVNQSIFTEARPLNLPSLPPEAIPRLKSYVPAAILSYLEAGYEELSSELRQVSVMFIKLPQYGTSIKHPYQRTLPEAQSVMQALQAALYKYAGSINKFNVDDKGITLVAALGLPPLSHSDDAARSVNASLDIQSKLEELGRDCVIGITTGWVFCGPIGNEQRREYTMVGTVVNMAARLMQAAEEYPAQNKNNSSILIDAETFNRIQMQKNLGESLAISLAFETEDLATVKGKTKPVTAYRPLRKLTPPRNKLEKNTSRNIIFGMEEERAILSKCLLDLHSSNQFDNRKLVIIEADAGSGKSCLLREVLDTTRRKGIRTLVSAGDSLEQATPYYAWQKIFQRIFGLETQFSDRPTTRAHVLGQLPPIRGEKGYPAFAIRLSPLLNSVLPLDFPENQTTVKMESDFRDRLTHQYLSRLLQRNVAGIGSKKPQPTVIIFEDGQWLDDATWELILDATTNVEPLLIVVATRRQSRNDMSSRWAQIKKRLNNMAEVTRIRLVPLGEEENRRLIQAFFNCSTFPGDAFKILRHRTGGNPMFGIGLLREWQNRGFIAIKNQEAVITGPIEMLAKTPIPTNIQQIVTSRLERLTPVAQIMLKSASVLGKEFTLWDLDRIYPMSIDEEELDAMIGHLIDLDLLERKSSEEGEVFGFTSDFIREVTSALLPNMVRNRLERGVVLGEETGY